MRFPKGGIPWNVKPKIEKTCPKCGKKFEVKQSKSHIVCCSQSCAKRGTVGSRLGAVTSPETKLKQRNAKLGLVGEAHWNWRGGSGSQRKIEMRRDAYIQWRKEVFKRDNYTCQLCGVRGTILHADHIQPWSSHPDLRYEISNGRTLCVPCHHMTPSFPKKLIPKEMRVG